MNIKSLTLSFILLVAMGLSKGVYAQSFDYKSYPTLNFTIDHMDLDLVLNEEGDEFQGAVSYQVRANTNGTERIVLEAAHMDINTVSVNDNTAEFNLRDDSLYIELTEAVKAGRKYNVAVTYEAAPRFGLLRNNEGTVWTSLLPRSVRHIIPVIDHPRVSFSSNILLTVPSGFEAVATGMQMDRRVLDVDNVVFTFRTEKDVPASALAFAVGQFDKDQTSFGLKRISLVSERGIISEEKRRGLLDSASDILRSVQRTTGREFPFEGLNVVVLKDHYWETKSWGASTIFLYQNRGSLETQLRRGIYGQWFGVFQREEQWKDAEAISLYQTILHHELVSQPALLKKQHEPAHESDTVYETFGVADWNRWQKGYSDWENTHLKTVASRTLSDVLVSGPGVYTWNDYARFWYNATGQPFFDSVSVQPAVLQDTTRADSVVYRVDYDYDQAAGSLKLSFKALKGIYEELITLPLVQTNAGEEQISEVTFIGAADSVVINVPTLVQNVHIDASGRPELNLEQYKPAEFLIYTLRNGTTIKERREAAEKLGAHTDNPDLQLAISDFLRRGDLESEVRAALLTSLGKITQGADGTEQSFLNALNSEDPSVQRAGLMALQHYSGNEAVEASVQSFTLKSDSLPVFNRAVGVFSTLADSAAFDSLVRQVVRTDTAGHRAIAVLHEWADRGQGERAVRQAEFYLSDAYDFPVRKSALQLMVQHDHTPENWKARAEELLSDVDPRIRYLMVSVLTKLNGLDPVEMIIPLIEDEYDARVFTKMQEVIGAG